MQWVHARGGVSRGGIANEVLVVIHHARVPVLMCAPHVRAPTPAHPPTPHTVRGWRGQVRVGMIMGVHHTLYGGGQLDDWGSTLEICNQSKEKKFIRLGIPHSIQLYLGNYVRRNTLELYCLGRLGRFDECINTYLSFGHIKKYLNLKHLKLCSIVSISILSLAQ